MEGCSCCGAEISTSPHPEQRPSRLPGRLWDWFLLCDDCLTSENFRLWRAIEFYTLAYLSHNPYWYEERAKCERSYGMSYYELNVDALSMFSIASVTIRDQMGGETEFVLDPTSSHYKWEVKQRGGWFLVEGHWTSAERRMPAEKKSTSHCCSSCRRELGETEPRIEANREIFCPPCYGRRNATMIPDPKKAVDILTSRLLAAYRINEYPISMMVAPDMALELEPLLYRNDADGDYRFACILGDVSIFVDRTLSPGTMKESSERERAPL